MKSTIKYFITEIKTDGKPIPETFNIFKYLSQLKEVNITISTVTKYYYKSVVHLQVKV